MPMGMKAAAATMPVHVFFPVTSVTRAPTATVCIHDPTFETRAADQMRAKFFLRSGCSDENATPGGYGGRRGLAGSRAYDALAVEGDAQVVEAGGAQGGALHVDDALLDELDEVLVEGLHAVVLAVGDDLGDVAAELWLGDALGDATVGDHDLEGGDPTFLVGAGYQPLADDALEGAGQ